MTQTNPPSNTLRLGELLVRAGYVTDQQVQVALRAASEQGCRLGTALVRLGYLDRATLARALGKLRRIPWLDPSEEGRIDPELARRLLPQKAHQHRAMPIRMLKRDEVLVAFETPPDIGVIDELSFVLGAKIVPCVAPEDLMESVLDRYYPVPKPAAYRMVDLEADGANKADKAQSATLQDMRADLELHDDGCVLVVDGEMWRNLVARKPILDWVVRYVRQNHDATGQLTIRGRRDRMLLAHFNGLGRPVTARQEPPGVAVGAVDPRFSGLVRGQPDAPPASFAVVAGTPVRRPGEPGRITANLPSPQGSSGGVPVAPRGSEPALPAATRSTGAHPAVPRPPSPPAARTTGTHAPAVRPASPAAGRPNGLPPAPPRTPSGSVAPPRAAAPAERPPSGRRLPEKAALPSHRASVRVVGAPAVSRDLPPAVSRDLPPAASRDLPRAASRDLPPATSRDLPPVRAEGPKLPAPPPLTGPLPPMPPPDTPSAFSSLPAMPTGSEVAQSVPPPPPPPEPEPEIESEPEVLASEPVPPEPAPPEPEPAPFETATAQPLPPAEPSDGKPVLPSFPAPSSSSLFDRSSGLAASLERRIASEAATDEQAAESAAPEGAPAAEAPAEAEAAPPEAEPPEAAPPEAEADAPPKKSGMQGYLASFGLDDAKRGAPEPLADPAPLFEALEAAADPDAVATALVEHLSGRFAALLVLVVKGDSAMGWRGRAQAVDEDVIEAVTVPLSEPSVLARAKTAQSLVIETPEEDEEAIHRRLWRLLKLERAEEVAALPVVLAGRVVNLVYVHPRVGEPLPPNAKAVLQQVADASGEAFARLIRARRK